MRQCRRYVVPAAPAVSICRVALEQVDNSGASDGNQVEAAAVGVFEFDAVSITQAMVARTCTPDDHTFDDTAGATNHIKVGRLVKYVSATKGWIDIAR
jgi:hypothetical protein